MSKRNTLNEPRIGWMYDGNDETPEIVVMLRDTGSSIEMTVPFKGDFTASDDPRSRWWAPDYTEYGDDPDRSKYQYESPRALQFRDTHGWVALVGCRTATANFTITGVSFGKIVANYAVLGDSDTDYSHIDAMRTDIPALIAWTGFHTMEVQTQRGDDRRVKEVQMTIRLAEPLVLDEDRHVTMHIVGQWTPNQCFGTFSATEPVVVQTEHIGANEWFDHIKIHSAMLDLVSLAAWEPFGYRTIEVSCDDDPPRGYVEYDSRRWGAVRTYRLPLHEESKRESRFLFAMGDIGIEGVRTWLQMRDDYSEALAPLLGILRSEGPTSPADIIQSGVALEYLGYLIDEKKKGGATRWKNKKKRRSQISFNDSLDLIIGDMEFFPVGDRKRWKKRAHACYMGLKHYDKPTPDSLDLINSLRENLLVLRCWVALQLGVDVEVLKANVERDRQSNPYIGLD